jgi:hypothetical protein
VDFGEIHEKHIAKNKAVGHEGTSGFATIYPIIAVALLG